MSISTDGILKTNNIGKNIILLGAGNVASSLAPLLCAAGHRIKAIYSRTLESAARLSGSLPDDTRTVTNRVESLFPLIRDCDFVIISLTDDATSQLAATLPPLGDVTVLHTSGSLPIDILARLSERYGSFYPLQTFTRGITVCREDIPMFVEGNTAEVTAAVRELACDISPDVFPADSALRRRMHIAAVFACNFVTYLETVANDLLLQDGLTLEVLHPLIRRTVDKILAVGPDKAQTGPARRGDIRICEEHLSKLDGDNKDIYQLLTRCIMKRYNSDT